MYILQETLISLEELQKIEFKNRLPIFFSALDLRPYAKLLVSESPRGAVGHNREALLRALFAAPFEGITTFTALHNRLENDLRFYYQCGFDISRSPPSISTISRLFTAVKNLKILESLFHDLVKECYEEGLISGDKIAVDSTSIDAYEKKVPQSKLDGINAAWGAKFDSFGNKLTWFGYKLHLAVDVESELPIDLEVTPANVNDGIMFAPLIESIAANGYIEKADYIAADAGYDQIKNYEIANYYNTQAIIPLNLRNEKEPPAGFSFNGTPRCSMGHDMVYWGSDKHYLKFRCPHAVGKENCLFGQGWCSNSDYGMVVKVNTRDNLRRFSVPHRDTQKWNRLYNKRTSVERCNSRLKEYLTVNDLHVRGIEKVKAHVYLNAIVLLASALAAKKEKRRHTALSETA